MARKRGELARRVNATRALMVIDINAGNDGLFLLPSESTNAFELGIEDI